MVSEMQGSHATPSHGQPFGSNLCPGNLSRLTSSSIIKAFLNMVIVMEICVFHGASRMATP